MILLFFGFSIMLVILLPDKNSYHYNTVSLNIKIEWFVFDFKLEHTVQLIGFIFAFIFYKNATFIFLK